MKKLLLTAVAFTAVVLPAMAADLAPVYKAPLPPPSWTGFYLGGTVGGIFTNNSVDVTTTNTANNISGNLSALGLTAGPASAAAATWQAAPSSSAAISCAAASIINSDRGSALAFPDFSLRRRRRGLSVIQTD
jgi:opacity protein-like surface antigen